MLQIDLEFGGHTMNDKAVAESFNYYRPGSEPRDVSNIGGARNPNYNRPLNSRVESLREIKFNHDAGEVLLDFTAVTLGSIQNGMYNGVENVVSALEHPFKTVGSAAITAFSALETFNKLLIFDKETNQNIMNGVIDFVKHTTYAEKVEYISEGLTTGYLSAYLGNVAFESVKPLTIKARIKSVLNNMDEGTRQTDFYVKPNGDAVPSTGYRYMSSEAGYLDELSDTMVIPENPNNTYFSFDNYSSPQPGLLQVPHDAAVKGSFDTLQVIDDLRVPNGQWGNADWLEPFTKDFSKFGPGGATQVITNQKIILDELKYLTK